jgi:hypothetical protein
MPLINRLISLMHIWSPAKCRDLVPPCAAAGRGGTRYPGTRLPGTRLPGTRFWHKVAGTKLWRPATNTFHGNEHTIKMITVLCK